MRVEESCLDSSLDYNVVCAYELYLNRIFFVLNLCPEVNVDSFDNIEYFGFGILT